jgi:hypothetical protein
MRNNKGVVHVVEEELLHTVHVEEQEKAALAFTTLMVLLQLITALVVEVLV